MKADVQCGRAVVNLELPDSTVMLEMEPLAPLADPAAAVRDGQPLPLAAAARLGGGFFAVTADRQLFSSGRSNNPLRAISKLPSNAATLRLSEHHTVRWLIIARIPRHGLIQRAGVRCRKCSQAESRMFSKRVRWWSPIPCHHGLQVDREFWIQERSGRDGGIAVLVPKDMATMNATKEPLLACDAWVILKDAGSHSARVNGYSRLAIIEMSSTLFAGRGCSDSSPVT